MTNTETESWSYTPVPPDAVPLFRMCWQLESWLRTIVYVELRANQHDWEAPIESKVRDWPPRYLSSDKRLHHMSTPHQSALSYLTFGQLWDVISSSENWELFKPYFPPKDNTDIRIEEVKAIRNRIAHFREPHPNDMARLELFMKDMEAGIRRFCARYTIKKAPPDTLEDYVFQHLEQEWEQVGYGIELLGTNGWLYAPGAHRMEPKMNANLEMLFHENYCSGSLKGVIYRITLFNKLRSGPIDAVGIFTSTKHVHKDVIHIFLSPSGNQLSATIPAILGNERTAEAVIEFLSAGIAASYRRVDGALDRDKLEWPEYVLWPDHMLTIFFEEMREPILELSNE